MEKGRLACLGRFILRWIPGFLLMAAVMYLVWLAMTAGLESDEIPPAGAAIGFLVLLSVIYVPLGILGLAIYLVAIWTNGIIFDFSKPLKSTFRMFLFRVTYIVISGSAVVSLVFLTALLSAVALLRDGLLAPSTLVIPMYVAFIGSAIFFADFCLLMAPVARRMVKERLFALGVPYDLLERGRYVAVTNPGQGNLRKQYAGMELGMMWLRGEKFVARCDRTSYVLRRDELVEIDRWAHPGSALSVIGGQLMVLTYRKGGEEIRIRFHPLGLWTVWGAARVSDRLADELRAWKEAGTLVSESGTAAPGDPESPSPIQDVADAERGAL